LIAATISSTGTVVASPQPLEIADWSFHFFKQFHLERFSHASIGDNDIRFAKAYSSIPVSIVATSACVHETIGMSNPPGFHRRNAKCIGSEWSLVLCEATYYNTAVTVQRCSKQQPPPLRHPRHWVFMVSQFLHAFSPLACHQQEMQGCLSRLDDLRFVQFCGGVGREEIERSILCD
jgi:hypothetical protein